MPISMRGTVRTRQTDRDSRTSRRKYRKTRISLRIGTILVIRKTGTAKAGNRLTAVRIPRRRRTDRQEKTERQEQKGYVL